MAKVVLPKLFAIVKCDHITRPNITPVQECSITNKKLKNFFYKFRWSKFIKSTNAQTENNTTVGARECGICKWQER